MQAERVVPVTVVEGVVTAGVPPMLLNQPMGAVQFVADLPGPQRNWTAQNLTPGLTFSPAGLLSGTPTVVGITSPTFIVNDGA